MTNPLGGTVDFVLFAVARQRDLVFLENVANAVCGQRTTCMVNFWTDRNHIPTSGDMPVVDLAVLSASYERHPNYQAPHLRLACWLYSTKADAAGKNCFVMPGAKIPWEATPGPGG